MQERESTALKPMALRVNKQQMYTLSVALLVLSRIQFGSTHIGDLLGEGIADMASNLLLVCALTVLLLLAFSRRYPKDRLPGFLFCTGIIGLSWFKCRATNLLIGFLYLYYSDAVRDKKRFARAMILLFTSVIALTGLLSVSGLIGTTIKQRAVNDTTRYSLGFGHANHLGIMVFVIICMVFFIESDRRRFGKYWKYGISALLTLGTFLVTNTFSFLALSMMLMGTSFAYDAVLSKAKLLPAQARRFIRTGLVIFGALIGAVVYYIWKNPYILTGGLKTLRTRFLLSQKYITAYGIKPFGSRIVIGTDVTIPGFPSGYYYLDNGFVRLFVESGFVAGILVLFGMLRLLLNLIRHARWQQLIIVLCILAYLFNEQKMITVFFNPFWLLMRDNIFASERSEFRRLAQIVPEIEKTFDGLWR